MFPARKPSHKCLPISSAPHHSCRSKTSQIRDAMYENAFNAIEKALRAEEGIANELDYVEQTSWVLFLRYLRPPG